MAPTLTQRPTFTREMSDGYGGFTISLPELSKTCLRRQYLAQRALLGEKERRAAARIVAGAALEILPEQTQIAAVYFPVGSELDVLPLVDALRRRNVAVCLPVVVKKNAPLIFRLFDSEKTLVPNAFNIPEPPTEAPVLIPNAVFAPLTAFDRRGSRLGYGGGYYDRTLKAFQTKPFFAGVAFSIQECAEIPCEKTDFPLDCIITEKETIQVNK